MDFSEKWHKNPSFRYETLKTMKEEPVRTFPMVLYWDTGRTEDLATISGVYGAYPVPDAFCIPLVYAFDR